MKRILLSSLFFLCAILTQAQNATFDNAFPSGWMFNGALRITKYSTSTQGCDNTNTGLVTTPILAGVQSFLATSPASTYLSATGSFNVSMDVFAYAADAYNLNCAAGQAMLSCQTRVRVYIVPGAYNSMDVPTGSNVLGMAEVLVTTGTNNLTIPVTTPLTPGMQYRLFFHGMTSTCNGGVQQLVIDNINIRQDVPTATFSNTLPNGWDFNPLLSIGAYNTPDPGCANNIGLLTPQIAGNATSYIATSPAALYNIATGSFRVNFDFYAFNANSNFECAAAQTNITCPTRLRAYIVPAAYDPTLGTPTGSNVLGQAEVTLVTGNNTLVVPVTGTLMAGTSYKLYIEGITSACASNAFQRYAIDNLAVSAEPIVINFDNAFPADWMFARELRLTQYQSPFLDCSANTGLLTPPIGANSNSYIATSPATQYSSTTGSFNVSFILTPFAADVVDLTACNRADASLNCDARVRVYLVPGNYTSTAIPTGANNLGMAELTLSAGNNVVSVPVTGTINSSSTYRLFIAGITGNCSAMMQQYVLDNIRILEVERAVLPVSLTAFNAARKNGVVALTWETSQEINNRGFHLQRNVNGEWKNVAFVFSKAEGGNSSSNLSYSYNDHNTHRGVSQYRLLQVDIDGKGKYSEIRSVRGEAMANRLAVYPNPSVNGNVNILFEDATSTRDVIVSDVAGRVVKQYKNIGANSLTIENLVDGYYTIQVTNRTTQATAVEKVIVKKR